MVAYGLAFHNSLAQTNTIYDEQTENGLHHIKSESYTFVTDQSLARAIIFPVVTTE